LAIEKDDGHYEEYPAYLGRDASAGFKFALLGIPEAKYEIRENPHPDYHLIVEPIEADDDAYTESVAEQVAKAINEDGRLRANHI
jgi:hypothetical protein